MKSRVLYHNAGKETVIFKTETWHQNDPHTAHDAKGGEIKVNGTWHTGVTPSATYRLAPGEYCEVKGHGIAIGAGDYVEEYSTGSVCAVIEAKEGDDVRLSHNVDASDGGWNRSGDPTNSADLWKKTVSERVGREAPLPNAAADREQLIRRVTLDLFGESPDADEVAAFTADKSSDALAKLIAHLQGKPRIEPFSGKLPTGETTFHVTAADPDAAKKPRAAKGPGIYVLSDNARLLVSQTTTETQRTNKAVITFLSSDHNFASPQKPFEIALPDGNGTYGIVWQRGSGTLWVMQKGLVRKYDFISSAQLKEIRFEPGSIVDVPEPLRNALQKVFKTPDAAMQPQGSQKPKGGEKLNPGTEEKLPWGEPAGGLRAAIVIRPALGKSKPNDFLELYLAVQNVSDAPIRLSDSIAVPKLRELYIKMDGRIQSGIVDKEPTLADFTLQPREVAFLRMFMPDAKNPERRTAGSIIADELLKETRETMYAEMRIDKASAGAWTGKLVTGETNGEAASVMPRPKSKEGQGSSSGGRPMRGPTGRYPGDWLAVSAKT